jgi:hypothetical protein
LERDYDNIVSTGSTLHALVRIPGTLQLAHVHDLADVIRVVGAEIANGVRPSGELLVVSGFHKFLNVLFLATQSRDV